MRLGSDKGFTLIELMIVVLILGALVTLAIPVYSNIRTRVQERACWSNERSLDGAIQSYAAGHGGRYPTDKDEALTCLIPEYIQRVPSCPAGGDYDVIPGAHPAMRFTCSVHGVY
ncbi:MAG: type II secretion system protein [Actinobacteria bacterium]|nr:MAG: type II secretion system protein [Actinomycetota bacterium]